MLYIGATRHPRTVGCIHSSRRCWRYVHSILQLTQYFFISAVIDVYSGWCGPCKAVLGLFRRVKNELGDELLKFATVSF